MSNTSYHTLQSKQNWSLYIKQLGIQKTHPWFENLMHPSGKIYILSMVWDDSGKPAIIYPDTTKKPEEYAFKIDNGGVQHFIGDGIEVLPPRQIIGGLNVAIFIFKDNSAKRQLGVELKQIQAQFKKSELFQLIKAITDLPLSSKADALTKAADDLCGVIEDILKQSLDKHLATFQGSYGVHNCIRTSKTETLEQNKIRMVLNLVSEPILKN
ncbi:MAG: hypothetical protein AB8B72_11040 [Crocinitomicaceae bacterium]